MSSLSESSPAVHVTRERLPGVIVADRKGTIRSVNDDAVRIFGYTRAEMVGKNVKMLMPPAYAVQHDSYMARFFTTGTGKVMGTTRIVTGQRKGGRPLKLRLALSYMPDATDPLISAMIEEVAEHSFTVVADHRGVIESVSGNPRVVVGRSAEDLVGKNVSVLCPPSVEKRHDMYMRHYKGPLRSKIVGLVRNLEVRHFNGSLLPVSLEVSEISSFPHPVFSGHVVEVEGTTEAVVSVGHSGLIETVSDSCKTLFGYEVEDLLGKHFTLLVPSFKLREGSQVASCQHKDGSTFYVSVQIHQFVLDGVNCWRGMLRRVQTSKPERQRSETQTDYIFSGDLLGWYEITKTLGSGYFGNVKMATHRLTGLNVAVKTLKRAQYQEAGMMYPPREITLINRLNHPNICRLYDTITCDDAIYMITELVPGGELFDYVAQKDHLDEAESRNIMRALVSATDYMHRSKIVHRDLKLENIMLDGRGNVKIIDLGLGNFFDESGQKLLDTFCGSADYAAPELWKGSKYVGPEVDIWSLGVVLFVISTGFIPFNDSTHILSIRYHWPKAGTFSAELKDLVGKIFQPSTTRIRMDELLADPWLNDCGRIKPIERHPLKMPLSAVNEEIIDRMEGLGFAPEDVTHAVITDAHNQLTTTYYLLEHQAEREAVDQPREKRLRTKQASMAHVAAEGAAVPATARADHAHGADSTTSSSSGEGTPVRGTAPVKGGSDPTHPKSKGSLTEKCIIA